MEYKKLDKRFVFPSQIQCTLDGEGYKNKNNSQEPSNNVITTNVILALMKATCVKVMLFNMMGEVNLQRN